MAKRGKSKAKTSARKASAPVRFVRTPSGGRAAWASSLALFFLVCLGFVEQFVWLGTVVRELALWLFVLALVLVVVTAVRRYKALTLINLATLGLSLIALLPFLRSTRKTPLQGPIVRVGEVTFSAEPPAPERITSWVNKERLDVLALVGVNDALINTLDSALPIARVFVSGEAPRRRVVYARAPKSKTSNAGAHPDVRRVRIARCDVELGVFDLPAVLDFSAGHARKSAIDALPKASKTGLSIWLGHFGGRPQSADLSARVETAQKRDSRLGHGLLATTPAFLGPLGIAADHVLIQGWIAVRERSISEALAGDGHRAVLATLELTNPACY